LTPRRDTPVGLTSDEAAERLAETGPNELPEPARPSLARRVAGELLQPLVLLLLGAAAVSAFVLHEPVDAAAIAAIVVLNAAIGVAEEGRATRALDYSTGDTGFDCRPGVPRSPADRWWPRPSAPTSST